MKFADLHLHTHFSDGTFSPEELLRESKRASLACISVVDHDTVSGVTPATEAAKGYDIEVLPGIEMSTEYNGVEVHILGYLIEHHNPLLIERLSLLKKNRIERVHKIVEKLNRVGIKITAEDVFKTAYGGIVGRMHIALALAKARAVDSVAQAFERYIGDKGPAYVLGFKFSPQEAIKLIKECDGVPILAHPYVLGSDKLIIRLVKEGIMGLEVYYPEHSQGLVDAYLSLAKKYNLLVTGGSDCHGQGKPSVKVGAAKVPYQLVERLKEAQKNK